MGRDERRHGNSGSDKDSRKKSPLDPEKRRLLERLRDDLSNEGRNEELTRIDKYIATNYPQDPAQTPDQVPDRTGLGRSIIKKIRSDFARPESAPDREKVKPAQIESLEHNFDGPGGVQDRFAAGHGFHQQKRRKRSDDIAKAAGPQKEKPQPIRVESRGTVRPGARWKALAIATVGLGALTFFAHVAYDRISQPVAVTTGQGLVDNGDGQNYTSTFPGQPSKAFSIQDLAVNPSFDPAELGLTPAEFSRSRSNSADKLLCTVNSPHTPRNGESFYETSIADMRREGLTQLEMVSGGPLPGGSQVSYIEGVTIPRRVNVWLRPIKDATVGNAGKSNLFCPVDEFSSHTGKPLDLRPSPVPYNTPGQ